MATLGAQLKKFRVEKGLSQPELAESIGIEQSYLSKLENDKSLPSDEIFDALLSALAITSEQIMENIELNNGQQKLLQVKTIRNWHTNKKILDSNNQRRFLYACTLFIVLGVSLFYAGLSKKIFTEVQYEYFSYGIVLQGEPDNIFENWDNLVYFEDENLLRQKQVEMENRKDPRTIQTTNFKGSQYTDNSQRERRFYTLTATTELPRPINGWFEVLGVFFFSLGLLGFFLERKLIATHRKLIATH